MVVATFNGRHVAWALQQCHIFTGAFSHTGGNDFVPCTVDHRHVFCVPQDRVERSTGMSRRHMCGTSGCPLGTRVWATIRVPICPRYAFNRSAGVNVLSFENLVESPGVQWGGLG